MMQGNGSMFFGGGFMWIFWLLVIGVIVAGVKTLMSRNTPRDDTQQDSPLSILEKRYARGEIDREEYQEKKRELED
jgi:putative membrane protein